MSEVWLFSYGTLRQREVQLATFGRELAGETDALEGYVLGTVMIRDESVVATSGLAEHLILRRGQGVIDGVAFAVTPEELARADGAVRPLQTKAEPRFAPNGEFLGMVGVNTDVTGA